LIIIGLSCLSSSVLYGQCNRTVVDEASLYCSDAPILCQIECLDGFTGTLPDSLLMPQPMSLCNGGEPNNLSWFAFVAGSDSINLTLIPSNCNNVPIDTTFNSDGSIDQILYNTGVQAGIYSSCDFEDDDREIVCSVDCNDVVSDISLASGDFILGQVYYLLVDGCAGSVCDYEVMVNYGEQAFEMPEITTITNEYNIDFETDTLCAGATVGVTLSDLDLDVSFEWSIFPPSIDYPTGFHPVTDTNSVDWKFSEPGDFEICVFASNFCDANDTVCFNVVVDSIPDEYFTEISICQECFPIVLATSDTTCIIDDDNIIVPTILTEDPNNDGLSGWFGFTPIMGPGLASNEVPTSYGCSYTQYVNVSSIPIQPREEVILSRCPTDYPFDFYGTSIDGPVTNRFITIDNASVSGCDSLISLTVVNYGTNPDVFTECMDGNFILHFDLNSDLPEGSIVSYKWFSGVVEIFDTDGIDSTMLIPASGPYSVEVTINTNGNICTFIRGIGLIDIDDVTPEAPELGSAPTEICNDGSMVAIWVEDQSQIVNYEWSLIPSLPFVLGVTSDTIYVDATGNSGFQYCVKSINECGESMPLCEVMSLATEPTVSIDIEDETCIDSIVTISSLLSIAEFEWNFGGGQVVNTSDFTGPGPYEVNFSNSGVYNISVSVTQGVCKTAMTTETINVLESFELPIVDCNPASGEVEFDLGELPDDVIAIPVLVSPASGVLMYDGKSSIIVSEVGNDTEVIVSVIYETSCGDFTDGLNCTSNDCPAINLKLTLDAPDGTCSDPNGIDLSVIPTIDGDITNIGDWSGDNIDENGVISLDFDGGGMFTVEYSFLIGECPYSEDIEITIDPTPSLDFIIEDDCFGLAGVDVLLSSDIVGTFGLDGSETTDGAYTGVLPGQYTASVMTVEGCADEQVITIESPTPVSVSIQGAQSVSEGDSASYHVLSDIDEPHGIIWKVNGEAVCQEEVCEFLNYIPEFGDEICVTLVISEDCFFEDCITVETFFQANVFMPNVFSPNGDNNNDTFHPITNDPSLTMDNMSIFDRWGNNIFSMSQTKMGEEGVYWDGTYKGKAVSPGVYIYVLSYIDNSGESQTISGDLTLIR